MYRYECDACGREQTATERFTGNDLTCWEYVGGCDCCVCYGDLFLVETYRDDERVSFRMYDDPIGPIDTRKTYLGELLSLDVPKLGHPVYEQMGRAKANDFFTYRPAMWLLSSDHSHLGDHPEDVVHGVPTPEQRAFDLAAFDGALYE